MKIIVGITSWKERIGSASVTLRSLLDQTRPADAIEFNLDWKNFPLKRKSLPKEILNLEKENGNLSIRFQGTDMKVWQKSIPTIRRHKGESYILVTCDDDVIYPRTYLEEIERNMDGCEWLCTKDNVYTFGQFMAYSSVLIERMIPYLTDELITETLLDDHTMFHLMRKVGGIRGNKTDTPCDEQWLGYSFRRMFVEGDAASIKSGDYPMDVFIREREILKRHGIVD